MDFTLNGQRRHAEPGEADTALDVVRDQCELTGTKLVCGAGVCGACTVLLNGTPITSCLAPAVSLAGANVTTVEGIASPNLHPVQRAFLAHDALQCGFCTPGFVVEAVAFYDRWRSMHGMQRPSRDAIAAGLSGHLCRCGAYDGIFRAVSAACAGEFDSELVIHPPRVEAETKVTGSARYTVDVSHPGQLEGGVVRSSHAHARIASIDLSNARQLPGVAAVALARDRDVVRYVGQAIAAIAAPDRRQLRRAMEMVRVEYEPLPAVIDADHAARPDAPKVYRGLRRDAVNGAEGPLLPAPWKGNVRGPSQSFSLKPRLARRQIEAARDRRDPLLIEATFRTGAQSHTSFEPHAAVAKFDGDHLTVHLSTQSVGHMARQIADRFAMPESRVRVIAEHVGGGFGSKLSLGDEAIAAVALAREARAPVRVVLSREEELSVTGYRPATHIDLALLPDANGNLDALSIHARAHAGVAVNSTIAGLARLIYPARAKELVDYDVVTHQPPGSPFRGPGGPALCFALEQGVDEAARRLAVDPIALRQRWDPDLNRQRLYRWAASVPTWTSPRTKNGERMCRGVGVAAANWLYWYEPGLSVRLAVRGGRLVVSTGTQDMGTGSRTVLARTVAAEFDIAPWQVDVQLGDSSLPNGPLSGGSRTTATLVPATLRACAQLKVLLGSPSEGANWEQRIQDAPDMEVTVQREPDGTRGDAVSPLDKVGLLGTAFDYVLRLSTGLRTGRGSPGAVVVTEIEVDTQLGHVQVLRAHVGLAVGRIRAPELARSQVCGAVIQGVGHALHEERQVDPATGLTLTAGLEDYRIPGLAETPEIDVHFDEAGFEHVDGGGVGLGEVAALAVAASIANAVRDATGRRPFQLPLRPDRMIGLLEDGAS